MLWKILNRCTYMFINYFLYNNSDLGSNNKRQKKAMFVGFVKIVVILSSSMYLCIFTVSYVIFGFSIGLRLTSQAYSNYCHCCEVCNESPRNIKSRVHFSPLYQFYWNAMISQLFLTAFYGWLFWRWRRLSHHLSTRKFIECHKNNEKNFQSVESIVLRV